MEVGIQFIMVAVWYTSLSPFPLLSNRMAKFFLLEGVQKHVVHECFAYVPFPFVHESIVNLRVPSLCNLIYACDAKTTEIGPM